MNLLCYYGVQQIAQGDAMALVFTAPLFTLFNEWLFIRRRRPGEGGDVHQAGLHGHGGLCRPATLPGNGLGTKSRLHGGMSYFYSPLIKRSQIPEAAARLICDLMAEKKATKYFAE